MSGPVARNPRDEAAAQLPDDHEPRVLEPSPPASRDPAWYADDPTKESGSGGVIVTPVPGEGTTWDELAASDNRVALFAADHWLSATGRLRPLPPRWVATRDALHQLAFFALAPARHAATGKLGLRYTWRGFGTPFFGDDEQARIEGVLLVHQEDGTIHWTDITTLGAACDLLGVPYREEWYDGFRDPLPPVGADAPLAAEEEAAGAVTEWFGFATLVLERLRRAPLEQDHVSRVQLWPEHFDVAVEIGSTAQRASYGASPGDAQHPEPHLYVAPWGDVDPSDRFWNDHAFHGASLPYRRLLHAENPVNTALEFFMAGLSRLESGRGQTT